MSCLHYCCYCCCYCCDQCCPHRKQKPEKPVRYPHIEYKTPDQANQFVSSGRERPEKLPPHERQYVFAQPPSEGIFRHQHTPPPSTLFPVALVTDQPRRQARSYTPTYSPHSSPVQVRRYSTPTPEPSETISISDSGTIASLQSAADSHPTLQFSLYYDIQRRVLAVHLQQAYNLPVVTKGSSTVPCSPFILVFLLPSKEQTFESRTVHRDLNPFINQIFDFPGLLPEDIRKQTLVMKVLHSRKTKHELIGVISLPLEDADLYGVSVKMSIDDRVGNISSECRGQVLLSITHSPTTASLHGLVLRAKDLLKVNGTGTACPYIKVYQLYNGKRQHKWKSSVKRSTLMPIFNEPFRFELANLDVHSVSLEILIMDHNRFSGDEVMGVIRVGDSAPEETGRSHWSEVLRTPGQAVSRWHSAWPVTHVYDGGGGSDRESVMTN